ncbi:MAG: 6,7-dimethyl-8-ribityllumazine synthase [Candidatus Moraniibacteriota bacterium]
MQRTEKELVKVKDASKYKVGIVVSDYYRDITDELLTGALETCREWKVTDENISITRVSGSFEIPYGCLSLLTQEKPDAIVTLGVIVKGETNHDEVIAHAVAQAIMDLTIKYETPISFGVVTVNNLEQAIARSSGENNKGVEATVSALESAMLMK